MFEEIEWLPDRMTMKGLTFRLEHLRSQAWDGGDHFRFYKTKELVAQYMSFFAKRSGFTPQSVFEIGIYGGGSTAFWFEVLNPKKHIAVDLMNRDDTPYFKQWLANRKLDENVKTIWRIDQADQRKLRQLVSDELGGVVDLVLDDASHLYGPSKASFEALFPICRHGGFYIIEDWAWDHWREFSEPRHAWANEVRLTQLVIELIEAAGSGGDVISNVHVYPGFVAVERGCGQIHSPSEFKLDDCIVRRPTPLPDKTAIRFTSRVKNLRSLIGRSIGRKSVLPE